MSGLDGKAQHMKTGISDQTKISRLLEEIYELKNELTLLKKEKEHLEDKLGIVPFKYN